MTTKKISNTLSRWHKVADAVKAAAQKVKAENQAKLTAGACLSEDTFKVRKDALKVSADSVAETGTPLYLRLLTTLFRIRKALAHANTRHHVSDLLAEQEENKQTIQYYTEMIEAAQGGVSVAEYESLIRYNKERNSGNATYRGTLTEHVTFVEPVTLEVMREKLAGLEREKFALSNRVADANATKLEIEIDLDVAVLIGL